MPYSLVLHCFPKNGSLSPEDLQGQKALALFLQELIQKQDEALAARLHAPGASKPFTTAIVYPMGTGRARGLNATGKGLEEIKIRLTLLNDALYPLVSQFFLRDGGGAPMIQLGGSRLGVSKVTVTLESGEPWAGFAAFEAILAKASEAPTSWIVRFYTPTSFKTGDAEVPMPVPRLCFQSWLNSWDEHSPCPFFANKAERKAFLEEVVEGNVSVTYSQLSVVEKDYYFDGRRVREEGFVGVCRFSVKPTKVDPEHRRLLTALADYSFYCGTGKKTTMGMGVTKPINPDRQRAGSG